MTHNSYLVNGPEDFDVQEAVLLEVVEPVKLFASDQVAVSSDQVVVGKPVLEIGEKGDGHRDEERDEKPERVLHV